MDWVELEWNQKTDIMCCNTWLNCISYTICVSVTTDNYTFRGQVLYIAQETQEEPLCCIKQSGLPEDKKR